MPNAESFCRILSLDGGGAKGFYTLGVLREIEAMVDCPLYQRFELIFGIAPEQSSRLSLPLDTKSTRFIQFIRSTYPGLWAVGHARPERKR
jgi:hypothetical protein